MTVKTKQEVVNEIVCLLLGAEADEDVARDKRDRAHRIASLNSGVYLSAVGKVVLRVDWDKGQHSALSLERLVDASGPIGTDDLPGSV